HWISVYYLPLFILYPPCSYDRGVNLELASLQNWTWSAIAREKPYGPYFSDNGVTLSYPILVIGTPASVRRVRESSRKPGSPQTHSRPISLSWLMALTGWSFSQDYLAS
ncbi:unnamed protein product, partial [Tuber aestivum]